MGLNPPSATAVLPGDPALQDSHSGLGGLGAAWRADLAAVGVGDPGLLTDTDVDTDDGCTGF